MARALDIGDLRHRVALMRNSSPDAVDAVGQPVVGPATIGTYCALVECTGGAEDNNGNQLKGILEYRITLRADYGPYFSTDSFAWTSRGVAHTLNIVSSVVDPLGVFAVVTAREKSAVR